MAGRMSAAALFLVFFLHGCWSSSTPPRLKYTAAGNTPELLAVYEGWFGEPNHIDVGYNAHDRKTLRSQIEHAKRMGISAFVMDWYGDRDEFVDQTYALMQKQAAKEHFHIAVMYDESTATDGATDAAIADLTMFRDSYLNTADGRKAYLTYQGRPVIFVWPRGHATNWNLVRQTLDTWNPKPLLIDENLPGQYGKDFNGFYPWVQPGAAGWAPDGSHWGKEYLIDFYKTMATKYPDKILVGGAWAQFNDAKASWGLNRHISARCGQTFLDTLNFWKAYVPKGQVIPFVLVETWNDYEEGTDIEPGLPTCGGKPAPASLLPLEQEPASGT